MKRTLILLCSILLLGACSPKKESTGSTGNTEMNRFIGDLMKQMTLDEKIGQLNLPGAGDITTGQASSSDIAKKIKEGKVGGLFNIKEVAKIKEVQRLAVEESRLKIPLLFGMDVIHGYKTGFPIPLAMAATWNTELIGQSARVAAVEASADGICWTFSPMVDICRDARWGRVAEGAGEDPFLGGEIAQAMVKGYQGSDLKQNNTIMACVKHFALYGASEAGRDYNTVDMSRNRMYNEYLLPYQAAIEAGAGSIMASFNEIDGVPATANKWLLTDLLRKEWGFNGFVVSDYTGISEMIDHGIGDLETVSARALDAGLDMDMVSEGFLTTLKKSVEDGKIKESQIDQACRLILEAKYKLGLFDDPYKYCDEKRAATEIYTDEHRALARQVAAESLVLLKNDKNILPLKKQGTIALVGPLANSATNMPGTWSVAVDMSHPKSLLDGLKEVAGDQVRIVYAKGSNLTADAELEKNSTMFGRDLKRDPRTEQALISEALQAARSADVVVAALGEASEMSGESSCRTDIEIPETQQNLLKALVSTGKPVVLVLFAGRPMALPWEEANVPAILNVWFGGTEAAYAISDVLFGDANPSGKLTVSFPQNVGQVPLFYNHKNTGRPLPEGKWFQKFRSNYLDVSNEPLYPFGFGLSYTTFGYSDITLSSNTLDSNGNLTASITVTNTGPVAGSEVVQLYIRDLVASITRPVKELKGFQKISLQPGESRKVEFAVSPELLKFYNYDLQFVCEPGDFDLMIGGNCRDVKTVRFTLK